MTQQLRLEECLEFETSQGYQWETVIPPQNPRQQKKKKKRKAKTKRRVDAPGLPGKTEIPDLGFPVRYFTTIWFSCFSSAARFHMMQPFGCSRCCCHLGERFWFERKIDCQKEFLAPPGFQRFIPLAPFSF